MVAQAQRELIERGVEACDAGDFKRARRLLEAAAAELGEARRLPARALASYGLAVGATERKRIAQAIGFCQTAIGKDFVDGDLYLALARVYLMGGSKRKAIQAIEEGLRADAGHAELRRLHGQLGVRATPPLGFLPRGHPLNRLLGRLRRALSRTR
jgi:tetratricopeptide (TPR) repeat protein